MAEVRRGPWIAEELQMYVETLAKECDRFEYALTSEDVE